MLEFSLFDIRMRISLFFPAVIIVMLSLGDVSFTLQCLTASLLHECGHFTAMLLFHDPPACICCGAFGVRVERKNGAAVAYTAQAMISLAGPCANLLCAAVLYALNGITDGMLIHVALGFFNLLPVEGLDGGEGAYRLLCLFCAEKTAYTVARILSVTVLLPLTALGFYFLLAGNGNFSLLLLSVYLILLLIFKEKH